MRVCIRSLIWLLVIVAPAAGEDTVPIRHLVDLSNPAEHLVTVTTELPSAGAAELELFMAVWTPGSYLVREYARHVEGLAAHDGAGAALAVSKSRKNRWLVSTGGAATVTITYRLYCREASVRTNWADRDLAVINGAATFLAPVGDLGRPHEVRLLLPAAWEHSVTALPPHEDGEPHHYRAATYDQLVDSPIVCGNPALYPFEVGGIPHLLANFGEAGVWDGPRSARDTAAIVQAEHDLWGVVPYDRYVFLNVLAETGGGLEHGASSLLMSSRWRTREPRGYQDWLGLVSHELFHAWNIKRLRPRALGPFDYENEVHTDDLWVVEGFTSYYDDLLLCRARLLDRQAYLQRLSENLRALQTTPGRLVQPLRLASYDAWIKFYRPDENAGSSSISYYTKGAVVGWLLDAEIRRATAGARSLDDLMRQAYTRYGGGQGYTSAELRALASEVAGADLDGFFARAVDGTEELDYQPALEWFGLALPAPRQGAARAWLGLTTKQDGGRLVVSEVRRGTPAYAAGVNVDDELLAIDGFRVLDLTERLDKYRPDDKVTLLVARRQQLTELTATLGREPADTWQLVARSRATAAQRQQREAWLMGK